MMVPFRSTAMTMSGELSTKRSKYEPGKRASRVGIAVARRCAGMASVWVRETRRADKGVPASRRHRYALALLARQAQQHAHRRLELVHRADLEGHVGHGAIENLLSNL